MLIWCLVGIADIWKRIYDERVIPHSLLNPEFDWLDYVTIIVMGCALGPCVLAHDLLLWFFNGMRK